MAEEIEYKLDVAADAAAALAGSDLLADPSADVQQHSRYFDTPDHKLAQGGFSVRIRRTGKKRVQTVKAAGQSTAGLFARGEWERTVRNDAPILDDTTPVKAFLGANTGELAPVFDVHIRRRTWTILEDNAEIELALDVGEVLFEDRKAPVSEIELELKKGSATALFALARKLDVVTPVRLGVLTKSQRGYRLAKPGSTVFKAEKVTLSHDMTTAEAYRHIAQACIRQFRLNEPYIGGSETGALHQARVALRRLRSAFTIFTPILGDGTALRLREELRWLASELGHARNLDVLSVRFSGSPLFDRIEAARETAYDDVATTLASRRARMLMLDLSEWLATGDMSAVETTADLRARPARAFATTALDRFRKKVKKGGRDLIAMDDEARHDLRKDAKKLRYAAEFFSALFDDDRSKRRYKRFISALEQLQDRLGLLNDIATAPLVLEEIGLEDAADPIVSPGNGRAKSKLLKSAQKAHDALLDTKRFWD